VGIFAGGIRRKKLTTTYMEAQKSLGEKLKDARETQGLTLRQVEEITGISNAYLSQLENNKIKKPSANILYKLAEQYRIAFEFLLGEAGIVEKKEGQAGPKTLAGFALSSEGLTPEEESELAGYLKYLRFKKKNEQGNDKGH